MTMEPWGKVPGGSVLLDVADGPLTRTDWAEHLIRNEILTGALRPGQRLKMAELQERYPGLSPTPLREALSRLSGSGLVDFLPNRGMRVAAGSLEELRDVHANRVLLETIAFERTIEAIDESWRSEVEHALEEFVALSEEAERLGLLGSSELIQWENAHRRFHFAVIGRCGSPWLLRLLGVLYEQSVRYRYLTIRAHPEFGRIAEAHKTLSRAALSADLANAVVALSEHANLTVASTERLDEVPAD
ncbi:MAG: GntR family transcriptional regulator [Acidimicrobiales bacterium]